MIDNIATLITSPDFANVKLGLELTKSQNLIPEVTNFFESKIANQELELINLRLMESKDIFAILLTKDRISEYKTILFCLKTL